MSKDAYSKVEPKIEGGAKKMLAKKLNKAEAFIQIGTRPTH